MRNLTLLLLALLTLPAFGTTRYIAQTAGTFTGGIACNGHTAITPATFNSTSLSPGDINYICGTITMAAHTAALTIGQDGTSGNPITIFFDSGAILSSPEWPADGTSGAIDVQGHNYVTVNGNDGTGGYTRGVIEATANGDSNATCLSGVACTLHGDSNGISAIGSTNLTVTGLAIIDMYVAVSAVNPTTGTGTGVISGGGGTCMYDNGVITNWTITNNLMHDMGWCLSLGFSAGNSSNLVITGNTIYNIDHGLALGGNASGANFSGVTISGNTIRDYSNWDTGSADVWHHDGLHIWGYSDNGSDTLSAITIFNNTFGGCIGYNITAHVFIEQNAGGTTGVTMFNNTMIDTCNGNDQSGIITTGVDACCAIFNNTIIGGATNDKCSGTSSSPNIKFINNVVSGCNSLQYVTSGGSFASSQLHNNIYANCPNEGSGGNCWIYGSSYYAALSSWQSATGQDASPSQYATSAGLNSSGVPQAGSVTIANGANLTSLCSGSLTSLCSDLSGTMRPSSGAWTVGAYQYGSSSNSPFGLTGDIIVSGGVTISGGGSSPITCSQVGSTLTCSTSTPGDSLFYTTDTSTPTIASTLYTGPLTVTSGETVRLASANVPLTYQNVQYTNTNWKCGSPSGGTYNGITCPTTGGVTGQPSSWNWTWPGSGSPSPMVESVSCTLSSTECQLLYIFGNNSTQCDSCTMFAGTKTIQPVDPTGTGIANNEVDPAYYYDSTHNREIMGGIQCTQIGGTKDWEFDSLDGTGWNHTGVTENCPVPTGSKTTVTAVFTRVIGDTGCGGNGCLTLANLIINGTDHLLNMALGMPTNPGSYKALGTQGQIDTQGTATCGANPCAVGRDVTLENVSAGYPPDAYFERIIP